MKNSPYLIFDFDGTLIDSFRAAMEKLNLLADEFNFRKISSDEVDGLRDLTSRELIKYLEIPIYKIPSVLRCARKHMRSEMQALLPFTNLPEILQELHDMKIPLGILTSNSSENVTRWLERNKMEHLFNFIHIESSYFGKKRILRKILKTYKIDKSQTFYIGDETRDVEAAKECGVYSVTVTWGFNSEKILTQHQPHYIVRKPEDILTICK
ncbi:MAG: haloacid dehalogenase [Gammaproteobacteria bacterium RIFCSPHIGHO2_12_FULL_40_19]|nr:MAG: haloacid dehalogenase [Gammaproteobacteria bacterium RIFCSPHIGHO2_12_FULL_40_19]HLB42937.1 HAD-IA family hydrolase [Gammaproteobacteria bacterium]